MDSKKTVASVQVLSGDGRALGIVSLVAEDGKHHLELGCASGGDLDPTLEGAVKRAEERAKEELTDAMSKWQALLAALQDQGLRVETPPVSRCTIEFHIDMKRHRVVGRSISAPGSSGEKLGNQVAKRIREEMLQLSDRQTKEFTDHVAECIRAGDHVGAAKYAVEHQTEAVLAASKDAVATLLQIDRASLHGPVLRQLLETIVYASEAAGTFGEAYPCAQALLDAFGSEFDESERRQLTLLCANGASQLGLRDTAWVLYKSIIDRADSDAPTRAWALRGMAMNADPIASEALEFEERAADAFIEAGDREQAITSLVAIARRREETHSRLALSRLDRALVLCDPITPGWCDGRAGIQQMRACLLSSNGRHQEALEAIGDAISLRKGLVGVEVALASSLYAAAVVARTAGDTDQAERFEQEASAVVSELPPAEATGFELGRMMCASDLAGARRLVASNPPGLEDEERILFELYDAVQDNGRPYAERIGQLEDARAKFEATGARGARSLGLRELIASAFAEVHRQNGDIDRATVWYEQVLELNPANTVARQNLAATYSRAQDWPKLIRLAKRDIELFGDRPNILYYLGHALLESKQSGAGGVLARAKRASPSPQVERLIDADVARVLEQTDHIPAASGSSLPPVRIDELESILLKFSLHVSANRRMEFWRRNDDDKHKYVEKPEALSKTMLWSYLEGHFQKRVEVLGEVTTGAGRMDVYLRFEGGLRVVIELKICGQGYSSTYAEGGLDQLLHYMESKGTALGYLIVFDARRRDNAKPFEREPGAAKTTLLVHFVDIRPSISD